MRYRGRVKVSKVDESGNAIKGSLKVWKNRKENTNKMYFDSKTEWECWAYLKSTGLNYDYQPSLTLYESCKIKEFKKGKIKDVTQRAIGYTPDFYLLRYKVYIEVKGYADELFKLRWKLFKLNGYEGYVVYSVAELKKLLKELKNVNET